MSVSVRQQDGVTILDLKGKITLGMGDIALRNAVQDAINNGSTKIVINMHDVSTIDSSGVGELVSAYTSAANRGAKLRLAALPAKITDVLTITQLITVFDVDDSVDEAVRSF